MAGAVAMKKLGEAAEKAARHKAWHWCRHWNGFSDMPLWRVVAEALGMPLYQVQAFVHRLDSFANSAEQRGEQRGSAEGFDPAEFGAALGMPADDAARIFSSLQERGWVAFGHVMTFAERNKDTVDEGAAERMRRMRRRRSAMKIIAAMADRGEITADIRLQLEIEVQNDVPLAEALKRYDRYGVTPRNTVTVTAEKSTGVTASEQKTQAGDPGETEGNQGVEADPLVAQIEACKWLLESGRDLLVNQMQVTEKQATVYIDRWRDSVRDDVVLKKFITETDKTLYVGARFHNLVTDAIRRHRTIPQLPLEPQPPLSVIAGKGAC